MHDDPITILIPTRERADVLRYALATCSAQRDAGVRILVSDNASGDATPAVVAAAAAADSRVVGIRAPRRLGMSEHWEFALGHVTEGWVIVIGDDDGLMPDALPVLRDAVARHPDLEAVGWPYSFYVYPDPAKPAVSGLLALGELPAEEVREGRAWLGKLAGFRSAYYTELPMTYHGMVHTRLLRRIRDRMPNGRLIGTRIPDVFLAVALAGTCGRYLRLPRSQSLFGSSPHSNGSASQGHGDQRIYEQFESESSIGHHPQVPPMRAISSFIFEALLTCREAGVVPHDVVIDTETAFTRAFLENASLQLPDPDATMGLLADGMGQEPLHRRLRSLSSADREALTADFSRHGWTLGHSRVANVLREHGVRDVAGAVGIAAAMYAQPPRVERRSGRRGIFARIAAAVRRLVRPAA